MPTKLNSKSKHPLVGIIMGSTSDWETMTHAAQTLDALGVPHETRVVSAHRTPDLLFAYASDAENAASKSSSPEQAVLRICPEWPHRKPCCRFLVFPWNRKH